MLKKMMVLAAMLAMALLVAAPALAAPVVNLGDETDESDDVRIVSRNSQLAANDCQTNLEQDNNADQFAFNDANGDDNRQGIAQSGVSSDSEQFCGNALLIRRYAPQTLRS